MIYIEEKKFDRQLDLLTYFSDAESYELIIWMYPESKLKSIFNFTLNDGKELNGFPVTTYSNGVVAMRTPRVLLTKKLIGLMRKSRLLINNNCDSCALYFIGNNEWSICTIGHEGMCLVKDNQLLSDLVSVGFKASLDVPAWW